MKRQIILLIITFAVLLALLSGCGRADHSGTAGHFEEAPVPAEKTAPEETAPEEAATEELSEEERFLLENTDEYLMWFNGRVLDLREIDPADYYATDAVMHRYRELFPFEPEGLLFDTPDSSCFSRVGYDYSREALAMEFRSTGDLFICYDFSAADWEKFSSADSLGKYYNRSIKDDYYIEKWDDRNH